MSVGNYDESLGRRQRFRTHVELPPRYYDMMSVLMDETGHSTRNDVIKKSVELYYWLHQKCVQGKPLTLSEEDLRAVVGYVRRVRE